MYPSPQSSYQSRFDQAFEDILRDGITAVRLGQRETGRRLLEKAAGINGGDTRVWLWMSATTDDPGEQRLYLERAVAADPGNSAAMRGLMLLSGQLDSSQAMPEGQSLAPRRRDGPEEAQAQTFLCPQCGGHMRYTVQTEALTCEYCGFIKEVEKRLAADQGETTLASVLPTARAHRWAEAQHRVSCERCGAVTLLSPGEKANCCPYCGSNRMIASAETLELVDPQVIALVKIDQAAAHARFKAWLGKGLLAPDDLVARAGRIELRPAFYPFWTFDGTLEIPWVCEVNEGSNDKPRWVARNGTEFDLFDDVLIPGVKAITPVELASIEPFNLKDLVEFSPDFIAGWTVLSYDRSMSDASLLAREKIAQEFQRSAYNVVETGREKRNLRTGGGKWIGMTFKHVLLPLWVGAYAYRGKTYRVLINGQTGKVGGTKPRDAVKAVMVTMGVVALLALLAVLLIFLASNGMDFLAAG